MKKLEHLSVLKISGSDAGEFLQGQMTQSIDDINDHQLHLTCFCNPQGRALATALVQLWDNAYYLILNSDLIEDLTTWLSRYILRSEVILSNEAINIYGISEKHKNNAIEAFSGTDNYSLRFLANDQTRLILLADEDRDSCQTMDQNHWIVKDIKMGIPLINKLNSLEYIPQMLNLDLLNAISFSKGCYTGQEVVARVQHRGKIKQRLYQFEAQTGTVFAPQKPVMNKDKTVGHVVLSNTDKDLCLGLAAINISETKNELFVDDKRIKLIG